MGPLRTLCLPAPLPLPRHPYPYPYTYPYPGTLDEPLTLHLTLHPAPCALHPSP